MFADVSNTKYCVFVTYPAEKSLYLDASNNAIGLGTVATTTTLTNAVGLPLTTGVTGTLGATNGGTAQSTYTTGNMLYASATNTLAKLAIGTSGQVLKVSAGLIPEWAAAGDTSSLTITDFTASASQTTFTVAYTVGLVEGVYRNGVKLGLADYTASNGTTVVLGTGATSGDLIQVVAFSAVVLANTVSTINFGSTGLTPNTATNGAVSVAGTLAVANGGTGVTTSTGTTAVVLSTSPTLVTPVLGVATATSVNKVALTAPATGSTLTIADGKTLTASNSLTLAGTDATTLTFPTISAKIGYLNLPPVGTKTTSYTLATGDVGKYVQVGSGGSITIPDATFAEGDAVSIFNNTSGAITITCTITTAYIAGTDADKATVSLATRGVATILFISGTVCVITGNVT